MEGVFFPIVWSILAPVMEVAEVLVLAYEGVRLVAGISVFNLCFTTHIFIPDADSPIAPLHSTFQGEILYQIHPITSLFVLLAILSWYDLLIHAQNLSHVL
ncbi:hypothetical protein TRVL_02779 [Trypanosoma vivax]|nr:hypothetical protein TRVL_02779 [Trypanosoma vivax]